MSLLNQRAASVEALAEAAVKEVAVYNFAASQIQRWFAIRLQWRFFTRVLKAHISKLQAAVRSRLVRRRYLMMLERRMPWKDMLRPNEAIVLTCPVIKTSDMKGTRSLVKVATAAAASSSSASASNSALLLKSLLTSKKHRQLILTTGDVNNDSTCPPPRLFYADPVTRTWKGEVPFDLPLLAAMTLTDPREFIIFSKRNEDKMDKEPIWSFMCTGEAAIKGVDWVKAIRKPLSTVDLVTQPNTDLFPIKGSPSSPAPISGKRRTPVVQISKLRSPPQLASSSSSSVGTMRVFLRGPLLMRQLSGPKKYFQHFFCLRDQTLYWASPGTIVSCVEEEEYLLVHGLTLTASCRVRLLETPRLLPNLPSCAFWLYSPLRPRPLKFRTMDLETAQQWVEAIGMAIARSEMQTRYGKADIVELSLRVLEQGRILFNDRSFLDAKIKFKDTLDLICDSGSSTTKHGAALRALKEIEFECYELRSRCNFMLGLYEKALDDCNEALRYRHMDESALRTRAASLERLDRLEESLAEYEVLFRHFPESSEQDLSQVRERVRSSLERLKETRETMTMTEKKKKNIAATQATIAAMTMKRPAIARQNSDGFSARMNRSGLIFSTPIKSASSAFVPAGTFDVDKSESSTSTSGLVAKRRWRFESDTSSRDSPESNKRSPSPTPSSLATPSSSVVSPGAEFRRQSLRSLMLDTSQDDAGSPLASPYAGGRVIRGSFSALAEADLATTISRNFSFKGRFEHV